MGATWGGILVRFGVGIGNYCEAWVLLKLSQLLPPCSIARSHRNSLRQILDQVKGSTMTCWWRAVMVSNRR